MLVDQGIASGTTIHTDSRTLCAAYDQWCPSKKTWHGCGVLCEFVLPFFLILDF